MRFWLAKWRFIIMCTSDATFSLSASSYQLYYLFTLFGIPKYRIEELAKLNNNARHSMRQRYVILSLSLVAKFPFNSTTMHYRLLMNTLSSNPSATAS